jgi:hypothetical protein
VLTLFQPHIGASSRRPLHPVLVDFVRAAREHASARHDPLA